MPPKPKINPMQRALMHAMKDITILSANEIFSKMSCDSFMAVDYIFDAVWVNFDKEKRKREVERLTQPYAAK